MTDNIENLARFKSIILNSPLIKEILYVLNDINQFEYYLGAGCIAQTVWNYNFGKPYDYGIKDIDFIYYDQNDLSAQSEERTSRHIAELLSFTGKEIDCKNQARVHLWYQSKFGVVLSQYESLERAIDTWPTTASAVGVRIKDHDLEIYAPYGLEDLLSGVVRANKLLITESVYSDKSKKWKGKWDQLTIIPW